MKSRNQSRNRFTGGLALGLLLIFVLSAHADGLRILNGHRPRSVERLQAIGGLPADQRMDLVIGLPLRNRERLTNLLRDLYDPASTNYHHFLTAEQFAAQFGPSEDDYQKVVRFAKAAGLKITGTHANRGLLDVSGAAADVERNFHFKLRVYRHPTEDRTFFAPDAEPSVDAGLPILAINGLDNYEMPRPMNLHGLQPPSSAYGGAMTSGSGPRSSFIGKDFRAAYAPGVALTGAGQSVGLFELDGYFPGDIALYKSLAGLPNVLVTNVLLNGVSGGAGNGNIEVALDIDMAISMAPGLSQVIVYEGATPNDILNRMATDNLAKQLSSSWRFGAQVDPVREQIFQQFAAQGQSIFQASGDGGAYPSAVAPPSDDPFLTIVGGTSLTTTGPGKSWASETTWSGSGGGVSTSYAIPIWQQGVANSANKASATMRNVPDVAMESDLQIWIVANNGQQGLTSGTSAAAPLWAGFLALVNQQATISSKSSPGFLNPAIYAIGQSANYSAAFRDITTGNNTSTSSPTNYFATNGYDLCTGWGTPNGSNLISALLSPPNALLITPPGNAMASGGVGGPFTPSSTNYLLTTLGTNSINWALSNSAPWLTVSPAAGTITPGNASNVVTFSLNAAASNLVAGSYTATVWFTNLNDGFAQSRQFTLAVVTPPVIVSLPANQTVLPGATATFTVVAGTNASLFYQWQEHGTNLTDGANIIGANTSTLTIAQVKPADAGSYDVIVSNAVGSVTSAPVTLTVIPVTASGVGMTAVYSFTGGIDGGNPNGLLQLANGSFYGTTQSGGANGFGSVFQMASSGAPVNMYSFTGGPDGSHPQAALTPAPNGDLYGTTFDGGTSDNGTIFKISTNGAFTPLLSFNITNGDLPYASLALGNDGNFYGSSYQGGSGGHGTAFNVTTNGTLKTLVSFVDTNGGFPYAGLIQANDGKLYGTTFNGGSGSAGTIYTLTTAGVFTTLISFDGQNEGFPYGGLAQDENGNLYGTTAGAGTYGNGVIYRLSAGALTNLYSFTGTNDGAHPFGTLTQGADGNFYGTTAYSGTYGDGTVFRMTAAGAVTTIVEFDGYNGANPMCELTQGADGNIYGATQNGGANNQGVIFQITFSGAPQIVTQPQSQVAYSGTNLVLSVAVTGGTPLSYQWQKNGSNFVDGGDISGSTARILNINNAMAGDSGTYSVIVSNALGQVMSSNAIVQVIASTPFFTMQPTNQTVAPGAVVTINAIVQGSLPLIYQWLKNGTNLINGGIISGATTASLTLNGVNELNQGTYSLYVLNPLGVTNSVGAVLTVVPVSAPGTRFTTLRAFAGTNDGMSPSVLSSGTDGYLYGTTEFGGSNHFGTVFRVSTNGTVTNLATFGNSALYGAGPISGVTQGLDGNFYGVTLFGGTNDEGNVFRMTPDGTLTNIYSFTGGADGQNPIAHLTLGPDGNLYGSTEYGGDNGLGNIFRISTQGVFSNLYSFTGGSDGDAPTNALMLGADGNFYGVSQYGGASQMGSIFRFTTNGLFTNIYSFSGTTDGGYPNGPLAQGSDGALYGTTQHSTLSHFQFYGVIFKVTTNGAYSLLYTLNSGDGHYPAAGVTASSDGNFYGTIEFGGTKNNGTVFVITPSGTPTTLVNFDGSDEGANPVTALVQGADQNLYGTTSTGGPNGKGTIFRLAITTAPRITAQPAGQNVFAGTNVTFSVAAIGAPVLAYQWQLNGTNLVDSTSIIGSTNRVLSLINVQPIQTGGYSVIVSNSLGSTNSMMAMLTVTSLTPVFQSVTKTNGNLTLVFSAVNGRSYQLQYRTNLAAMNWINTGNPVTATSGTASISTDAATDQRRFYRVLLLP